jgi:hypothetical protein
VSDIFEESKPSALRVLQRAFAWGDDSSTGLRIHLVIVGIEDLVGVLHRQVTGLDARVLGGQLIIVSGFTIQKQAIAFHLKCNRLQASVINRTIVKSGCFLVI